MNDEVGHVLIDVDRPGSDAALGSLCAVPHTIRCRVLY